MVTMFAKDSPMSGPGPSDIEECSSSSMVMKHNNQPIGPAMLKIQYASN